MHQSKEKTFKNKATTVFFFFFLFLFLRRREEHAWHWQLLQYFKKQEIVQKHGS